MKSFAYAIVFAIAGLFAVPAQAQVDFDLQINFTGSATFQPFFDSAEAVWESIITEWTDGRNNAGNAIVSSLVIDATVEFIDGNGGILGSAGPTAGVNDGSFILATEGVMRFDSADAQNLVNNGTFEAVVLHEMGHVLGIGTLWTNNNLYVNGTGQYTGANGLAQYQTEFDPSATFVPVELDGGAGTANGHWDEGGITVIDPNNVNFGRTRSDALMTGFLGNDTYISNTTGGSLQDLGFNVDFNAIQGVPEPSSATAILILGMCGLSRRRRKTA